MSKQGHRKKKIFDLFSQNLEWVKEHPEISFEPDFNDGYICPLCFDVFFEKDLSNQSPNFLTLEDIPPKSLGGNVKALTCKSCNSKGGHNLDNQLLKRLTELDFYSFLPKSEKRTTLEIEGKKMTGSIKIEKNKFNIHLEPNNSDPKVSKNFIEELKDSYRLNSRQGINDFVKPLVFKKDFYSDERKAEIALLRVAYLIAFSTLGNGFLINGNLFKIREQLKHPQDELIPKVFWINYNFPEDMIGVNIIKEPSELRCFLIIFKLSTKSKERQFAIALPGPSEPGIEVYENIEKYLCNGDGVDSVNIELEHITDDDFLKNKDLTFWSNYLWQKHACG